VSQFVSSPSFSSSGSIRNVWALAWPLMIGLISNGLMIFFDRLVLARYSASSLNASTTAGTAYFMLLIIPLSIAAMSEVFAGRLHGEGSHSKIGSSVWQMIWFSLFSTPFFIIASYLCTPLFFSYSDFATQERTYFQTLLILAPFSCTTVALSGFFIGLGKPRYVTIPMILGNVVNILLACLFIFGLGPIPEMGIKGAAYASGLSQALQTILLLFFFMSKKNQEQYRTTNRTIEWTSLKEGIRIGLPAGLGHVMEVGAYALFFQVIAFKNSSYMTIIAILQSIFILTSFITEALSKSTTALTANLIGRGQGKKAIDKTIWSGSCIHLAISLCTSILFLVFPSLFLTFFLGEGSHEILSDPTLMQAFTLASCWMCLFFLIDGINWILMGALVASCDTKWIFYISTCVNWIVFAIPSCLCIYFFDKGPAFAWMNTFCAGLVSFFLYFYRYSSGKWLTNRKMNHAILDSSPSLAS